MLSLYPTLTELTGLPGKATNDCPSLVPLLKNADADWPHVSITYLGPGNYGLSSHRYRYIADDNGDEEMYDIDTDPYEWANLAPKPEFAATMAELKSQVPMKFAEHEDASIDTLTKLDWTPLHVERAPASKPNGPKFDVYFSNQANEPVKVFWMNRKGEPQPYGTLETGWSNPYQTRPGAVWMITDAEEKPLGYFTIGDRTAQAVVPPEKLP
jgi:VHL beta domain